MSEPEKPKAHRKPSSSRKSADVVALKRVFPPIDQPDSLNDADALKIVRMIAADSAKIYVVPHAVKRQKQRSITRPQIERCVQKGVISEGPFVNGHGNWQVNLSRYGAGEEITCVIAIEWVTRLIVVTTF